MVHADSEKITLIDINLQLQSKMTTSYQIFRQGSADEYKLSYNKCNYIGG